MSSSLNGDSKSDTAAHEPARIDSGSDDDRPTLPPAKVSRTTEGPQKQARAISGGSHKLGFNDKWMTGRLAVYKHLKND